MTPPFRALGAARITPLLLTCEHASRALPPGFPSARGVADLINDHWGWDIGAWALARQLARRLGASAVGGSYSRLVIDLNRPLSDPTLIVRAIQGRDLPWNARLTPAEIERRVLAYHLPYHDAIDRLIVRRVARGVRPFLLAVHSFTGELHGRRRDFDAGVLFADYAAEARAFGRGLARSGLAVRYNEPYSGLEGLMYSIERHGSEHRLPCLELELRQDLLRRPTSTAALARKVARALRPLLVRPGRGSTR